MSDVKKEFVYKGLTFHFVNPCIKFSQRSQIFLHKMLDYAESFADKERLNLIIVLDDVSKAVDEYERTIDPLKNKKYSIKLKHIKDLLSIGKKEEANKFFNLFTEQITSTQKDYQEVLYRFVDAYNSYNRKLDIGINLFVCGDTEAKELFELCLTEYDKLDTTRENDKDVFEYENFRDDVLNSFFFSVLKKPKG